MWSGIFSEHRAVYEAIVRRDPIAAQEAMQTHLTTVAEFYWEAIISDLNAPAGAVPTGRNLGTAVDAAAGTTPNFDERDLLAGEPRACWPPPGGPRRSALEIFSAHVWYRVRLLDMPIGSKPSKDGTLIRLEKPSTEAAAPTAPKRPPIRRRKLYEEVALRIEEMIREGRFAVGDSLPAERELMDELGVGRSAVREALMALARMGLVSVNSGERARVTAPTAHSLVSEFSGAARLLLAQPGGIRSFQEARMLLEIGLCRLAAQRATDADLEMLAAALEANREAIQNHAAFVRTDVAFHYAIASISRSPIFVAVHDAVVEWLMEQRGTALRAPGTAEAAYQAHKRIYDAIASGDVVAAEAMMEEHLSAIVQVYWNIRWDENPSTRPAAPAA